MPPTLTPTQLGRWTPDVIATRPLARPAPPGTIDSLNVDDIPSLASLREAIRKLMAAINKLEGRSGEIFILNDVTYQGDVFFDQDVFIDDTEINEYITNIINETVVGANLPVGSWQSDSPQSPIGADPVTWGTELINDTDYYEFDGSNQVLTIKQDGLYQLAGGLDVIYAAGDPGTFSISSSGSQSFEQVFYKGQTSSDFDETNRPFSSWSVVWPLAANDLVEVSALGSTSTNWSVGNSGSLSIVRLGDL